MAIIEAHSRGTPLSQGDILKGIGLFLTKKGTDARGFVSEQVKLGMCLVLSRQCVVVNKQALIVAGVMKYSEDVKPEMSFEESVDFLTTVRDGVGSPDQFYLGHIPGESGRFCARLDSLHTVQLPPKPEDRQAFVDEYRIAKLNIDYVRDLHIRVHQAFANMGFEDYQWLSNDDLKLVVEKGNHEIRSIEEEQRMAKLTRDAAGQTTGKDQITRDQNKLNAARKKMEPYAAEWTRRFPGSSVTDAGGNQAG